MSDMTADVQKVQTWVDFERAAKNGKVVLFGVGALTEIYFARYGDRIKLEEIVDNSITKQGFCVDEFVASAYGLSCGRTVISAMSALQAYDPDDLVVVVCGTRYVEQMTEELKQLSIANYYVILAMEEDRRNGCSSEKEEDADLLQRAFVQTCCENAPLDPKKIFFSSYGNYADHEKYITEALLRMRSDLDIVWAVNDLKAELPAGIRKIYKGNWKRLLYEMETAKIWILDLPTPAHVSKRPGQIYIQTKHWPSITLKRFYLDAPTFESVPERIDDWKRDGELIDHIIVGSDLDEESCRRGFGFAGTFLRYGSPRSDAMFHEDKNREKVYRYYRIERDVHTLLYAPTYRFDKQRGKKFHQAGAVGMDFERVKSAVEKKFGGSWYILLRLHPSVSTAFRGVKKPEYVLDVSDYEDSQELASAADITVSDFSSLMFDPAFVGKPVFLYAEDLQEYLEKEYDLLIPYQKLPFPAAQTNEELICNIETFREQEYQEKVSAFLKRYGVSEDGYASDRAAQFVSSCIG